MLFDRILARDVQCPVGSTFQVCGPKATWSGCCSINDCNFQDGVCPTNADISIYIAPDSPQTSFFESTPKATSAVGSPVTAGGSQPSTAPDTTTDSQTTITTTVVTSLRSLQTWVVTLTEPVLGGGVYVSWPSESPATTTPATGTPSVSLNSFVTVNSVTTGTATTAISTDLATTSLTSQSSGVGNETPTGGDTSDSVLSTGAIAGVAVGGILGMAGLSLMVFILCRHRRHARRMSSHRDGLRDEYVNKDPTTHTQASERRNNGDVFAPFGGRVNSINKGPNPNKPIVPSTLLAIGSRQSTTSNLVSPASPGPAIGHESLVSPSSPRGTGFSLPNEPTQGSINIQPRHQEPPLLDSRPVYFELESAATTNFNVPELPASSSRRASQPPPGSFDDDKSILHPESLRPGSTPNVVKDVQRQKLIRVNSGEAAVVSVGNKAQHARSGSHDDVPRIRATMNATDDDVRTNRHVNSWTHL